MEPTLPLGCSKGTVVWTPEHALHNRGPSLEDDLLSVKHFVTCSKYHTSCLQILKGEWFRPMID